MAAASQNPPSSTPQRTQGITFSLSGEMLAPSPAGSVNTSAETVMLQSSRQSSSLIAAQLQQNRDELMRARMQILREQEKWDSVLNDPQAPDNMRQTATVELARLARELFDNDETVAFLQQSANRQRSISGEQIDTVDDIRQLLANRHARQAKLREERDNWYDIMEDTETSVEKTQEALNVIEQIDQATENNAREITELEEKLAQAAASAAARSARSASDLQDLLARTAEVQTYHDQPQTAAAAAPSSPVAQLQPALSTTTVASSQSSGQTIVIHAGPSRGVSNVEKPADLMSETNMKLPDLATSDVTLRRIQDKSLKTIYTLTRRGDIFVDQQIGQRDPVAFSIQYRKFADQMLRELFGAADASRDNEPFRDDQRRIYSSKEYQTLIRGPQNVLRRLSRDGVHVLLHALWAYDHDYELNYLKSQSKIAMTEEEINARMERCSDVLRFSGTHLSNSDCYHLEAMLQFLPFHTEGDDMFGAFMMSIRSKAESEFKQIRQLEEDIITCFRTASAVTDTSASTISLARELDKRWQQYKPTVTQARDAFYWTFSDMGSWVGAFSLFCSGQTDEAMIGFDRNSREDQWSVAMEMLPIDMQCAIRQLLIPIDRLNKSSEVNARRWHEVMIEYEAHHQLRANLIPPEVRLANASDWLKYAIRSIPDLFGAYGYSEVKDIEGDSVLMEIAMLVVTPKGEKKSVDPKTHYTQMMLEKSGAKDAIAENILLLRGRGGSVVNMKQLKQRLAPASAGNGGSAAAASAVAATTTAVNVLTAKFEQLAAAIEQKLGTKDLVMSQQLEQLKQTMVDEKKGMQKEIKDIRTLLASKTDETQRLEHELRRVAAVTQRDTATISDLKNENELLRVMMKDLQSRYDKATADAKRFEADLNLQRQKEMEAVMQRQREMEAAMQRQVPSPIGPLRASSPASVAGMPPRGPPSIASTSPTQRLRQQMAQVISPPGMPSRSFSSTTTTPPIQRPSSAISTSPLVSVVSTPPSVASGGRGAGGGKSRGTPPTPLSSIGGRSTSGSGAGGAAAAAAAAASATGSAWTREMETRTGGLWRKTPRSAGDAGDEGTGSRGAGRGAKGASRSRGRSRGRGRGRSRSTSPTGTAPTRVSTRSTKGIPPPK